MKILNRIPLFATLKVMGLSLLLSSSWGYVLASTQPSDVNISMDYGTPYYNPAQAIVADGASIHVVNPTSSPHTLTHDGCRISGACAFDTGAVRPGETFIISSLPPGRYSYYCMLHPIMKGEIVVLPQDQVPTQPATQDHGPNVQAKNRR